MSQVDAIKLVKDSLAFVRDFDGEIPGNSEIECGNYLEHDLCQAKKDVLPILKALENYTPEMLQYSWHFSQK